MILLTHAKVRTVVTQCSVAFKGNPDRKRSKRAKIFTGMLLLVVLSTAIYTELLLFFYFETELLGHIGSLFNQKPEKFGWCHNLFDTFATYASLVYDVTNADCLATRWQHSRSCFRDFQPPIFNKRDEKWRSGRGCLCLTCIPFLSTRHVMLLRFVFPLIKA